MTVSNQTVDPFAQAAQSLTKPDPMQVSLPERPPDAFDFSAARLLEDSQREATPLEKTLDALSTTTYGSAGAAKALLSGRNPLEGISEGIQNKTTYGDILRESGMDPVTSGVLGFGLDVALDPITYTGVGALTKAGSAAKAATLGARLADLSGDAARIGKAAERLRETGELGRTLGAQADKGQRALITFMGKPVIGGGKAMDAFAKVGDMLVSSKAGKTARAGFDVAPDLKGLDREVFLARKAEVDAAARNARAQAIKNLKPVGENLRRIAKAHGIAESDMRKIMADVVENAGGAKLADDPLATATQLVDPIKLTKALDGATGVFARETQEALRPALKDMVTRVNTINAGVLARSKNADILIDDLLDDMGYLARRHTPEAVEHLREFGPNEFKGLGRSITEKHRALYERELKGITTTEANRLYRDGKLRLNGYKKTDHDLFFDDPLIATTIRNQEGAKAVASTRFIKDYVRQFGVTRKQLFDTPAGVGDVGTKITRKEMVGKHPVADMIKRLEESGFEKVETRIRGLEEVWLPRDTARAMKGHMRRLDNPGPFLEAFDKAQSIWKKWTLGVFPVYHTRNEIGDLWNAVVLGGMNVRRLRDAMPIAMAAQTGKGSLAKTFTLGGKKYSRDEVWRLASQHGVTDTGIVGELGNAVSALKDHPDLAGKIVDGLDDNVAVRIGMAVGTIRENSTRLALFMDRLAKGDAPEVAALFTKKHLIDYGQLTDFERNVLRRVMPFYSWTRYNVPLQLEYLLKKPGAALGVQKLREEAAGDQPLGIEGGTLPRFLREGLPLRFGTSPEGNPQFARLEGLLPLADVNAAMSPEAAGERGISLLSPFIQTPIEMMSNVDLFRSDVFNGDFTNLERYPGETGSFLGVPLPRRMVRNPLENIRVLTELNRLNPGDIFGDTEGGPFNVPRDRPDPSGLQRSIGAFVGRTYAVNPDVQEKRLQTLVKRKIGELRSELKKALRRGDEGNARRIERRIEQLREDPASLFR